MNIFFIILGLILIIYILISVVQGKFNILESSFWIIGSIIILILSIYPDIIKILAKYLGVEYPPSLLFLLVAIFLLFINFRNTQKITKQKELIEYLAQEIALLKNKGSL